MEEIFDTTNRDDRNIHQGIFGNSGKIQNLFQNVPTKNQGIFSSFGSNASSFCKACHGQSKTHIKNCLYTGINWCSFCNGCVLNHLEECPESKHFSTHRNDKKMNMNFETSATLKKQDEFFNQPSNVFLSHNEKDVSILDPSFSLCDKKDAWIATDTSHNKKIY